MTPDDAAREKHQAWMVDLFPERFSIMARAILAQFGLTYEGVAQCELVVDQLAEFTLAEARKIDPSRSRIVTVTFLAELQIRLTQYREHSVGHTCKWVREAVESVHIRNQRDQAPADQQASVAKGNEASPSTPPAPRISQRIKLRRHQEPPAPTGSRGFWPRTKFRAAAARRSLLMPAGFGLHESVGGS